MEFLVGYIIVCLVLNIIIAIILPIFEIFYNAWHDRKSGSPLAYCAIFGSLALISLVAIQVALK